MSWLDDDLVDLASFDVVEWLKIQMEKRQIMDFISKKKEQGEI